MKKIKVLSSVSEKTFLPLSVSYENGDFTDKDILEYLEAMQNNGEDYCVEHEVYSDLMWTNQCDKNNLQEAIKNMIKWYEETF